MPVKRRKVAKNTPLDIHTLNGLFIELSGLYELFKDVEDMEDIEKYDWLGTNTFPSLNRLKEIELKINQITGGNVYNSTLETTYITAINALIPFVKELNSYAQRLQKHAQINIHKFNILYEQGKTNN